MKTILRPLAAALLLCLSQAHAAPPQVSLVGVQFSAPAYNNEMLMHPFNGQKAVELALLLHGSGAIIEVDEDKSLDGLRLLDAHGNSVPVELSVWPFQKHSKDQRAAVVKVQLSALPPAGTGVMHLKGTLHFTIAQSRKQARTSVRNFKVGDTLKLGGIEMEVKTMGKPRWGAQQYPFEVTLQGDGAMSRLAEVKFFDAQGKEIESRRGSSSRMGFAGHIRMEISYRLKREVSTMRIQAHYWDGVHESRAPFDLTVRRPF